MSQAFEVPSCGAGSFLDALSVFQFKRCRLSTGGAHRCVSAECSPLPAGSGTCLLSQDAWLKMLPCPDWLPQLRVCDVFCLWEDPVRCVLLWQTRWDPRFLWGAGFSPGILVSRHSIYFACVSHEPILGCASGAALTCCWIRACCHC